MCCTIFLEKKNYGLRHAWWCSERASLLPAGALMMNFIWRITPLTLGGLVCVCCHGGSLAVFVQDWDGEPTSAYGYHSAVG